MNENHETYANRRSKRQILGIGDVEHFHWSVSEADTPMAFSANGSGLSLAASVELITIEAHLATSISGIRSPVRVPNSSIWSLLKASCWPARRHCNELRDGEVVALILPTDPNDVWWTQRLHNLLRELKVNGFRAGLARGLAGGVAEMVDNIWQHAETNVPGLLLYRVQRRKFAFSVADIGVGILASLRKNPQYKWLESSMDAIGQAIRPGVSRCDSGGMGFPSLLHALADLWGNARVRSGEASLIIDRTQDERTFDRTYLPFLPGLHISVRCALDAPKSQV